MSLLLELDAGVAGRIGVVCRASLREAPCVLEEDNITFILDELRDCDQASLMNESVFAVIHTLHSLKTR